MPSTTPKPYRPPKKSGRPLPPAQSGDGPESPFAAAWASIGRPAAIAAHPSSGGPSPTLLAEAEAALVKTRERLASLAQGGRILMIGAKVDLDGFAAAVLGMARRRVAGTPLDAGAEAGLSPACARLLGASLEAAFETVHAEIRRLHKTGSDTEKREWITTSSALPPGGRLLERTASLFESSMGRVEAMDRKAVKDDQDGAQVDGGEAEAIRMAA